MTVLLLDAVRQHKLAGRLYDVHAMLTELLCVGEMALGTPEVLPNPVGYLKECREAFRLYDEAAGTFGVLNKLDIADAWKVHRQSLDNVIEALEELEERYNPAEVLEIVQTKD